MPTRQAAYMNEGLRISMVRPGGLELPTFWFPPVADSIQLSYGLD